MIRRAAFSAILAILAIASPYYIGTARAGGEGKTEYFRNLLQVKDATIEDAIHATARYKGYEGATDIDAEIEFLNKAGVTFPAAIKNIKGEPLDKGSATHLLMRALGVKGGVMYRLFPGNQRYALREALDLGFLPADSIVSEKMSGADLLGLLVKVVEYTNKKLKAE